MENLESGSGILRDHGWSSSRGPSDYFAFQHSQESCIVDTNSTIYRKSSQLLGYADDLDLTGRNVDVVKEEYLKLNLKIKYIVPSIANAGHRPKHCKPMES